MNSPATDPAGKIKRDLEVFRSELEQDFLKESALLETKRGERLEKLEEMTRATLEAVDDEWQGLHDRVLDEISRERTSAAARMETMIQGLDRDLLIAEMAQSALCRLLGEDERKDAGS